MLCDHISLMDRSCGKENCPLLPVTALLPDKGTKLLKNAVSDRSFQVIQRCMHDQDLRIINKGTGKVYHLLLHAAQAVNPALIMEIFLLRRMELLLCNFFIQLL